MSLSVGSSKSLNKQYSKNVDIDKVCAGALYKNFIKNISNKVWLEFEEKQIYISII